MVNILVLISKTYSTFLRLTYWYNSQGKTLTNPTASGKWKTRKAGRETETETENGKGRQRPIKLAKDYSVLKSATPTRWVEEHK